MAHAKSTLADLTVRLGLGVPEYSTRGSGPEHDKVFTATAAVDGEDLGRGIARTKREAERLAAEEALEVLEDRAAGDGESAEEDFEGPWPVFEELLSSIVDIADRRIPQQLTGEEARIAIRDFSLDLYRELLLDLGEIVEDDEED
ncbi:MAG TPA: putative dsRNA-binding protein [Deinococcales bacterium]|nr:putative dsRNA-binding protein [Deinococcales bacterium]